jgi:hypothetical protein
VRLQGIEQGIWNSFWLQGKRFHYSQFLQLERILWKITMPYVFQHFHQMHTYFNTPIYIRQVLFLSEEVKYPKYHFPLKKNTLHSFLYPNLDDLKLRQMSLYHDYLKLDPKEKRITRTVNVFDNDLKDDQQDR